MHFFYDWQYVSEIDFVKSCPMHFFYDWQCVSEIEGFCERQSYHIFSYHQQGVSDIVNFVKGSLITSFPITNSEWVILHILVEGSLMIHHTFSYDQ